MPFYIDGKSLTGYLKANETFLSFGGDTAEQLYLLTNNRRERGILINECFCRLAGLDFYTHLRVWNLSGDGLQKRLWFPRVPLQGLTSLLSLLSLGKYLKL